MKRRRIGGYIDWVDVVMQRVRPGSFLSFTLRYGGHGSLPNIVEVFRPRARAYTTRNRKVRAIAISPKTQTEKVYYQTTSIQVDVLPCCLCPRSRSLTHALKDSKAEIRFPSVLLDVTAKAKIWSRLWWSGSFRLTNISNVIYTEPKNYLHLRAIGTAVVHQTSIV